MRKIPYLILLFCFGMAGGIFGDQILWPYFINRPLFEKYNLEQPPVYVTERKEVVIRENTALEEAIEKVASTVIGVRTKTKQGEVIEGTALAATNDGLIVTLASLLPQGQTFSFFIQDNSQAFQVLRRDLKSDLALVKLEARGLATAGFVDSKDLKLGERVFAIGYRFGKDGSQIIVNEGIIRGISADKIETNILEELSFNGSPVFNIEGEIIGLAVIDSQNKISVIPSNSIKKLLGI